MTNVTTSKAIERPASVVFEFVANMENNTRWQKGQERCDWTSEPPLALGSTYDQIARFMGKEIVSSFEVVEFEPGHMIRIKTTEGTMPIDVTRTVVATSADSCEITATVKGDAPGPMKLLGPLLDVIVRKSVKGDYDRLAALLEATS